MSYRVSLTANTVKGRHPLTFICRISDYQVANFHAFFQC